jgi:8-hydroxy-5-deazaflavin:NADPH oxidoreductase
MNEADDTSLRIGILGAGRIGGNAARWWAAAGHDLVLAFARDRGRLEALAAEIGARVGTPREAAEHGDVVVISVPWAVVGDALAQAGPLDGRIVLDTTNQFGPGGVADLGRRTAAQVNAARMPGARYVKALNTLTSGFQAAAAGRVGAERVAMFLCGDDAPAKATVARLIEEAGFAPVDAGGTADAAVMEAPRRPGAVYGEEFVEADARAFLAAHRR